MLDTSRPPAASDISAVICTYTDERWEKLAAAIRSLLSQQAPLREIMVVVDHNDSLLKRIRDEFVGVTAVSNRFQKGLSGARNTGVAAASGEIIASLDDDAEADRHWSARLAEAFSSPKVAGVGCFISADWGSGRPEWFPDEFLWVVGCTYRGVPPRKQEIRNPLGAAMALRRNLIEQAGGYLPDLGRLNSVPLGCEETELCVRIKQRFPGVVFLQSPSARVRHWVPAQRATWRYFFRRCFSEGLSKAAVSQTVGSDGALEAEKTYIARVLPHGVWNGLSAGLKGDFSGPVRSGAILAGLGITAAGYITGHFRLSRTAPAAPRWQPAALADK